MGSAIYVIIQLTGEAVLRNGAHPSPCLLHLPMPSGRDKMLLLLLLLFAGLAHTGNGLQNVSLTVSSLKPTTEGYELDTLLHELQMNWLPGMDADWIGLFNVSSIQQVTQDTQPLIRISPDDYPEGYYSTNISFAEQQYPNGWSKGSGEKPVPGDACLSYWIAAYKHNDLLEADCLKIHPTWMEDHRTELENMPLIGLFFPGTYNSVQYNSGSTPLPTETGSHFLLTEDSDVWGELIRGIRYLDIEIRYCPNEEQSSFTSETPNDDRCSMDHLMSVIEDVKEFLNTAKYEIIILDFHHFPLEYEGQTNLHREFVSLIYSELGGYILPFTNITYTSTLKEVWHTQHNLIVAYNYSETTKEFPWLWGPLPRLYGDHQTTEGLKTFLQQCMDDTSVSNGTTLDISMVRTAPAPTVSALNASDLADMTTRNITKWFHDYWWRHANLVATDIVLGNETTDVNVKACLDKANNVIFQVASED